MLHNKTIKKNIKENIQSVPKLATRFVFSMISATLVFIIDFYYSDFVPSLGRKIWQILNCSSRKIKIE